MHALGGGEAEPVVHQRDEIPPVGAQDLDASEGPAEALLLEPVEAERHHPDPPGAGIVDADLIGTEG